MVYQNGDAAMSSDSSAAFGFFAAQPSLEPTTMHSSAERTAPYSAGGMGPGHGSAASPPVSTFSPRYEAGPSSLRTSAPGGPASAVMRSYRSPAPLHSPSSALLAAAQAQQHAAAAASQHLGGSSLSLPHPSPYPLTSPDYPGFEGEARRDSHMSSPDSSRSGASGLPVPPRGAASSSRLKESKSAAPAPQGGAKKKKKARVQEEDEQSDEEADADGEERKPGWKRRRVVVACDRCRHKKIRCKGLPNARNICNNCDGMGYACTFDVSPTRSRGKYEILESRAATLLSALRSVAPELAAQFDNGKLGGPPGMLVANETAKASSSAAEAEAAPPKSPEPESTLRSDEGEVKEELHKSLMLPDVEEGRPRFFGGSSSNAFFHGLASRPPSPGAISRRRGTEHGAAATPRGSVSGPADGRTADRAGGSSSAAGAAQEHAQPASHRAVKRWAVLPRPQTSYPTNSRQWVQNLRRKNLCGVGRDDEDYGSEAWLRRYLLPERDLLNLLFNVYFSQLHPLMPLLHRPSMERDIELGRAEDDIAFRGLVFTVLAIASRFTDDRRVLANPDDPNSAGDRFAAASRLYHQVHSASLINVQVLLLTCTFSSASLGPGVGWTVLGVAIRALLDIGAHQERAYAGLPLLEQELRRRAFWATHSLDCIMAINLGRPLGLRLGECRVNMPRAISDEALLHAEAGQQAVIDEDASSMPVCGFIHLVKLNLIVSDVVTTLYASGREPKYADMCALSSRLDEWEKNIPVTPHVLPNALLRCGIEDVRMYTIKPFLYKRDESDYLRKMLMPQCAVAARKCLSKVIELHETTKDSSSSIAIFDQAWVSSTTFLITIWHELPPERLAEDAHLVEGTLHIFARHDPRFCSALLRRAHRILCTLTKRALPHFPDELRDRVASLIASHERRAAAAAASMPRAAQTKNGAGGASMPENARHLPAPSSASSRALGAPHAGAASPGASSWQPSGPRQRPASPVAISMAAWSHWNASRPLEQAQPGAPRSSAHALAESSAASPAAKGTLTPLLAALEDSSTAGSWSPWGSYDPSVPPLSSGFELDGSLLPNDSEDLAWADYFTRFLSESTALPTMTPEVESSRH